MTLVLSPDEIIELTSRKRASAQRRQLAALAIPFKPRTDGSLVVLRVHVESLTAAAAKRDKDTGPRLRFD